MKNTLRTLLLLVLVAGSALTAAAQNLTQYVNPFIGTGGHGHVFLGANSPFGHVMLGPTQITRGWDWCSGYHVSDTTIVGFAHNRVSGTGIGELGEVVLCPAIRASLPAKGTAEIPFTHKSETCRPGYYSVVLPDPNVHVELTATQRVGMSRYTFLNGDRSQAAVTLDLVRCTGWNNITGCDFEQTGPSTVTGWRTSNGWANNKELYFVMEFSQPVHLRHKADGVGVFDLSDGTVPVLIKVALSGVSVENARLNMQQELPGWDFDATVAKVDKAWNRELGRIHFQSFDDEVNRIFYTALYHTMTSISTFCDVNGEYHGADAKKHKGDFTNYTTLSLWDTYRAAHPLYTLAFPDMQRDFSETFLHIFDQQGKLPVWHLMGGETNCMVGTPGAIVMADLVMKGFVEDREHAYEAIKASLTLDERSLKYIKEYGYIPYDKDPEPESVSKDLENAIAFSGAAKVAQLLGHTDDYKRFYKLSQLYRKHFDRKSQFMRALGSDGKFRAEFDPFKSVHGKADYTEGNAWQYTWLVPHDVHGLVSLFVSEKAFVSKLDRLFTVEGDMGDEASPDISGLIGQYAHGNEPSHHVIYLYNFVGQPYKAAALLRRTMKEMYFNDYDGLAGNEDVGQMSAWYVLSAMGLYQVDPVGGRFVIGSPLCTKASITVAPGKELTVVARNNSAENIYVQSVTLNGQPYTKTYIDYPTLMQGGVIELQMGAQPSAWGTNKVDRP
ncbi:MAG: GH92 family glycosyl hydrolase [Bacteroidales bacterium]|nr:GH92 family glycosyl hydrolase [Bacteroidales bacterium]